MFVGIIALAVLTTIQFVIDKLSGRKDDTKGGTPMKNNSENKMLFGLAGLKTAWALLTNVAASVAMQA